MHLRNKLSCVIVMVLIASSFSEAQDTLKTTDLPICNGRAVKPCEPFSVPRDCHDIQELCDDSCMGSGLYYIYPVIKGDPLQVYCDMETDGGGWLVFQRREDGSEEFFRNWKDYKSGFGQNGGEFWLGNENLHEITRNGRFELRVDMEDFDGERRYATYDKFGIADEENNFLLTVGKYSGDAGDSLVYNNNMKFSTKNADKDTSAAINCAEKHRGAWWYKACFQTGYQSNLNGRYLSGPHDDLTGIIWQKFRAGYSLKKTEMKIRPYGV